MYYYTVVFYIANIEIAKLRISKRMYINNFGQLHGKQENYHVEIIMNVKFYTKPTKAHTAQGGV